MKRNRITSLLVVVGLAMASWTAQAAIFNLTGTGVASATVNGATVAREFVQPAGTGVLGSFVRLQSPGSTTAEEAYNTRDNGIFDNIGGDPNNHEITVGGVGFIDTNGATAGGEVMRFILDINEGGGPNSLVSLNEVQVFLTRTPNQPGPADPSPTRPANGTLLNLLDLFLVYQMDGNGNNRVDLDGDFSTPGSGVSDMFLDIPLSMFNTAFAAGGFITDADKNGAFIYLYSRFGTEGGGMVKGKFVAATGYAADAAGADAGFEEWAATDGAPICTVNCEPPCEVDCGPQELPEPGNIALFGIGILGAAVASRRRRRQ